MYLSLRKVGKGSMVRFQSSPWVRTDRTDLRNLTGIRPKLSFCWFFACQVVIFFPGRQGAGITLPGCGRHTAGVPLRDVPVARPVGPSRAQFFHLLTQLNLNFRLLVAGSHSQSKKCWRQNSLFPTFIRSQHLFYLVDFSQKNLKLELMVSFSGAYSPHKQKYSQNLNSNSRI